MTARSVAALAIIAALAILAHLTPASAQRPPHPATIDALAERKPFDYPLPSGERLTFDNAIPSPAAHLGYPLGQHFTRHHDIVSYFNALARTSDRVTITNYGMSHARRPLIAVTITSPRNHANLENILRNNRRLADPRNTSDADARRVIRETPTIAWYSYNVHGNEASCSEAAMQLAYTLAASTNSDIRQWLNNTVVVIDPVLNPDGRERYVNFFSDVRGRFVDTNPYALEHREPWPTGRSNHYLFDLNRDWAWLSQAESAARLAFYQRYLPHLHIDNHEQGHHAPHFFGLGDTPYNLNIPPDTKDMIARFGDHNAQIFDTLGLPFATQERFDYLYPGYGKVMPVYHGAAGLLTEQAGHSRGGLAINIDTRSGPDPEGGYTLTLRERIRNHFLTGMSYTEKSSDFREQQLQRFRDFHTAAVQARQPLTLTPHPDDAETINPHSLTPPRAYAVHPHNDPDALRALHALLTAHGAEITVLTRETDTDHALRYFPPFADGTPTTLPAGTWIIDAEQPKGHLVRTFMDRTVPVEDIATYDITAWSAPLMYGLHAHELFQPSDDFNTRSIRDTDLPQTPRNAYTTPQHDTAPQAPRAGGVAWLVPNDRLTFPHALSLAARHNIFARLIDEQTSYNGTTFPEKSLLIHTHRNNQPSLDAFIRDLRAANIPAFAVTRSIPTDGQALGNNANARFVHPRVMLLSGSPLSSLSTGHTRHLLDHQTQIDHSRLDIEHFPPPNLNSYTTIILPDTWGDLSNALSTPDRETLTRWVRDGGTLIAIGRSARWTNQHVLDLEDQQDTDSPVAASAYEEDDTTGDATADASEAPPHEHSYRQREHKDHIDRIPGALLHARLDTTHPLAAGVNPDLALHVFDPTPLPVHENGFVVARFNADTYTAPNPDSPFHQQSTRTNLHPESYGILTIERVRNLYNAAANPNHTHANAESNAETGTETDNSRPPTGDPLVLAGHISIDNAKQLAATPAVTHHVLGGGNVIALASDPTNRAMNKAAMRLLTNAITIGPSLAPALQPLANGNAN